MTTAEYRYSGKTWVAQPTFADGNCFFHAVFGERTERNGSRSYFDKYATFRRLFWSTFLQFYTNQDIPKTLFDIINNCFIANDSLQHKSPCMSEDFKEYIKCVAFKDYWVLIEEIPILSALWNVKIVLFVDGQQSPNIFEPNLDILGDFPFRNTTPLQEKTIRFKNDHFERLVVTSFKRTIVAVTKKSETESGSENFDFDDDLDETIFAAKKNYNKTGSAGVQGGLYQVKVLSLLLLNALGKVTFVLSTENPYAGKFDDIVIETSDGAVLLQAKHKEKQKAVKYEALFSNSPKANFSLAKYYVSFLQVRKSFAIKKIVILTNAALNTYKLERLLSKHEITDTADSLLHFDGVKTCYYTFNDGIVNDLKESIVEFQQKNNFDICISEESIKEFLKHLQFFDNFLEDEVTRKFVSDFIPTVRLARGLDSNETFEFFKDEILKWFTAKKGLYLSHLDAKAIFCDIRSKKYCNEFQKYDISFKQTNFVIGNDPRQIFHIIPCKRLTLNLFKLWECFEQETRASVLFVNPEDDWEIQMQTVSALQTNRCNFLVISRLNISGVETCRKLCEKLTKILGKYKYKKLVLVAGVDDKIAKEMRELNADFYHKITDDISFDDLTEAAQEKLKKKRHIQFQGIEVTLAEITRGSNQIIDVSTIETLARNERIRIGGELRHADNDIETYYIWRNLKRQEENIPEAKFRHLQNIQERIVLISDSAGMGKSTILTNLGISIKKECPYLWVVRIDLNNHSNTFRKALRNRSTLVSVPDLLNDQDDTRLSTDFMKNLFLKQDNVVLMIDAIDEVSSGHMDLVFGMISRATLQKNYFRIFITTRPHLCEDLEQELKVSAFSLEPFTKENQEDFLTNYWTRKLALEDEREKTRCRQYARALIQEMSKWIDDDNENTFAGIPLQTRMLAEVFQQKNQLDCSEPRQWEECKEFLLSGEEEPRLPTTINLVQLYELFIDKKRDIFVNEKGQSKGNALSDKSLMEKFEQCHDYHRCLALPIIFYTDECQLFRCFRGLENFSIDFVNEYVVRAGIVQKVEGKINFIHRTFAEFFAAQCIMLELKQGDVSENFRDFLLTEILIQEEYYVVRAFFNSLIHKEIHSLSDRILKAFGDIDYTSVLNQTKNSYLHLLAQEGLLGIMEFFISSIRFSIIDEREEEDKIELLTATDMNRNTPLHYACSFGHLNIAKALTDRGADVDFENVNGDTPLNVAAYKGHLELVEYLVNEADADLNKVNSYGENILVAAVQSGNINLVKFLMEKGAKPTGEYTTALHLACYAGRLNIVRYLVEDVGMDLEIADVDNRTPLHAAAHEGRLDLVRYLVARGCNVNAVNGDGNAAFHDAACRGALDVVLFLVENGANTEIEDNEGYNVVELIDWLRRQQISDSSGDDSSDVDE